MLKDMNISRPANDYDPAWAQYWAENPTLLRAVGADAAEGAGQEGEGGGAADDGGGQEAWHSAIEDEGLRTTAANFESRDDFLNAVGYEVPDWRDGITDEEAKKFAKDSPDLDHLAKRALEMRQKLGKGISVPGEDAKPEDVKAFRDALGIPEE